MEHKAASLPEGLVRRLKLSVELALDSNDTWLFLQTDLTGDVVLANVPSRSHAAV
jgi:hypothetical protein